MKFGKILKQHSQPGWVYINYKGLKRIISSMLLEKGDGVEVCSSWFLDTLLTSIEEVDKFLTKMEANCMKTEEEKGDSSRTVRKLKDLHKYAVLNYLAVLKIVKKHDKHFTALRPEIRKTLLSTALYEAVKTPKLFHGRKKLLASPHQPECPICLEKCAVPVSLTCGHEFCWSCLWKGDMEKLTGCPLCRKSQTLNPSEMNIVGILGGFSHKYFPRRIENEDDDQQDPVEERASNPACQPCVDTLEFTKERPKQPLVLDSKIAYEPETPLKPPTPCSSQGRLRENPKREFDAAIGSISHLRSGLHKDFMSMQPMQRVVGFGSAGDPGGLGGTGSRRRSSTAPSRTHDFEDDGCVFQLDL
mmetsp:Transcript_10174/g.19534  ORF Transcript_10174/g.19534 Transcript_10174/m.19534 type:complete len:359 (-) Transcript_10174:193-1269(-)